MARGGLANAFRCPTCQGILLDYPGALGCTGCGEHYPIRDGVAIFAEVQLSSEEHRQREIFSQICRTTFEGFRSHEDYSPRAIQIWKKLRYLRLMGCVPGALVVDVGCAQGFYARLLRAEYGAQVIGIDLSDSVFVAARQDAILGLNNSYCLAPAERLPLAGQIADFVICFDLLEHLPKPEEAVAEFVRILKPGGRLLIHMPIRDDEHSLQWFLAKYFPYRTTAQAEAIGHFYDQIITSHRLLEIVQALPLRVVRAEKFGGWFQPLHDWFLLALLGKASNLVKGFIVDPATSRPDPSAVLTSTPFPRDKKGISELLKRIYLAVLWTFRNLTMIGYVLVDLPLSRLGIGYTVYLLAERIEDQCAQ
jgi:2-polyprenyl-3-methyl-5-hydroxy-6-metoxy-1,4-benzoquinol methylase